MIRRVILCILLLGTLAGATSRATELYNEANRLYAAGDFDSARERYLEAAASGVSDPWLFYNLGNACFKSGDLGAAILWYERARRLAPRDEDIRTNLRFAQAARRDRLPQSGSVVRQMVVSILNYPTLSELTGVVGILSVLLFAWAVARLRRDGGVLSAGKIRFAAGVVSLLLAIAVLAVRLYWANVVEEAIIVGPRGIARSGPDTRQTQVFVVHEGTKVRVERRQEGWLLVRLPNGLGGWVPDSILQVI